MSETRNFGLVLDAQSVLNASGELNIVDLFKVSELTYYIFFGPGTSAGAVQIESAHQKGFTGTWAPEGSPVAWVAANRVHKLSITGASYASRARISTTIAGGTVSVFAIGN